MERVIRIPEFTGQRSRGLNRASKMLACLAEPPLSTIDFPDVVVGFRDEAVIVRGRLDSGYELFGDLQGIAIGLLRGFLVLIPLLLISPLTPEVSQATLVCAYFGVFFAEVSL